ncbi:MAG TPA: ATP-binding protein [Steroidobacteraceae bacterium]|nr:ATP-binding protein [Steroidobacteraceae bacterium]
MTTACWTQRTQLSLAFGPPDAKRLLNWMPAAIALTVFLVDFLTPRGLAASALYVLVPAACLWVPHAVMSTRMALITSALVAITYVVDTDIGIPTWISLTNTFVAIVLVWSVTWMVGLRNRHEREVATLLSQVRGLRERAETAESHVCDEISRQLHEGIGQELTVVGWELDEIREGSADATRVEAAATRLRERVTASQDAVRRLAVNLRRRSVDQASAPGETHAHIEWFRKQTGIRTGLGGEQLLSTLSPEGANCAFRVIQEALTNVAKHAYATIAEVEISEAVNDRIQIAITDDGRGMSEADRAKPASLGLIGLEERLLSVRGSLHIAAAAFGGTRLTAVIPRPPASK